MHMNIKTCEPNSKAPIETLITAALEPK